MASLLTEMGLQIWDAPGDFFSYSDLASNFTKINNHDHTAGKGVPLGASTVGTGQLQDNAVSGPKIQDGVVSAAKLGAGAGKYTSGLLAARPTAAVAGLGANYYATDTATLYFSDGTNWRAVASSSNRGVSNVSTAETISSTSYTVATTPDRVSIFVPANSIAWVGFRCIVRAITTLSVGQLGLFYLNSGPGTAGSVFDMIGDSISGAGGLVSATNLGSTVSATGGDIVQTNMQAATGGTGGFTVGTGWASATATRTLQPAFYGMFPIRFTVDTAASFEIRYKVTSASIETRNRWLYVKVEPYA